MKILVDDEARKLVQQLCDVALKAGGLGNMNPVLTVLKGMEDIQIAEPTAVPAEPTAVPAEPEEVVDE